MSEKLTSLVRNILLLVVMTLHTVIATSTDFVAGEVVEKESTESFCDKHPDALFSECFYTAEKFKAVGAYDSAMYYLHNCYKLDPKNPQISLEIAVVYIDIQDYKSAQIALRQSLALDSTDVAVLDLMSQVSIQIGDYAESIKCLEKITEIDKNNTQYLVSLGTIYSSLNYGEGALKVWNKIEEIEGKSAMLTYNKFYTWCTLLKNPQKGFAEYDALIMSDPDNPQYVIDKAKAYGYLSNYSQKIKTIKKGFKKFPNNPDFKTELVRTYFDSRDRKSLNKIMDDFISDERISYETKESLITDILSDSLSMYIATEDRLKKMMSLYPNEFMPYIDLSMLYSSNGREEDAYNTLLSLIRKKPKNDDVLRILIQYCITNDKDSTDDFMTLLSTAVSCYPDDPDYHRIYGSYLIGKDTVRAISELESVVRLTEDSRLRATVLTTIGDLYLLVADTARSISSYKSALENDEMCIMALNNYAYLLSVKGDSLDLAESMSAKTISSDPKNSTYLDTYAWVFYKKGDYKTALLFIEMAYSYDNTNSEITEHYGDILYKNGLIEKAYEMWNLSVKQYGENVPPSLVEKVSKTNLKN